MNPQYMSQGQPPLQHNNNPPPNPLSYPPLDYNGVQNANAYSPYSNGPNSQAPPNSDVSQKLQSLNLNQGNGPQYGGIPPTQIPPGQLPPGQLPPGANFPPNFTPGGQFPPGQRPNPGTNQPNRPPSGAPMQQSQFQPSVQGGLPPTSQPQRPPMSQAASQPTQGLPPSSTPGPQQSQLPPQSGQQPPVQSQMQQPQGQNPSQPRPPQPQQMAHAGQLPPQPGQLPPQPGQLPQQPGQLPPQPGQLPQPGQMPPHLSQLPARPSQLPQQPGQLPQQPGQLLQQQCQLPSHPGQLPQQPGQLPPQPGHLPVQPGQMPQQPGQIPPQARPAQMPPQPNQMASQANQLPPQPSQMPLMGHPQNQQQGPPQSRPLMPPSQGPPSMAPSQISQMPKPQQPSTTQAMFAGQIPPQPGQMQTQPGQMQPQPGQMQAQPGQMQPQPGQMQPQPGQMQSQPQKQGQPIGSMPPQHGQMPPQPQAPGQFASRPGQPPMPGQPGGFPGQQAQPQFNQGYQQPPPPGPSMPGLPHMPPPVSQQPGQQRYPGMPPSQPQNMQQPGYNQPPLPQQPQFPGQGMPPMPAQQPSGYPAQPPYPGQQPYSGQQPYPGQQPPYPGQQPAYPGYQQQPQQPVKRLDPDQMPSPIQVWADDQQCHGGLFATSERGQVPPLVTTDFTVDDQGNSSPRYIRSSMYSVPVTADLLKQTSVPFCLMISPMAETVGAEREPPLLDFAALTNSPAMGPVRCSRCKAYMCPAMKFVDAGRHFKCAFCKATTEVPMEYTQYVNSMQQYGRMPAEMALGTYEIVATKEYCRNNTLPNPPAIVFLIDVSYNSARCGLIATVCDNIRDIIGAIPRDEQTGRSDTRVGFITYSTTVHFYNIKGTLGQPQMLSVGDVGDMFVPLLEGFLVSPEESGAVLDALMQQIPLMFEENKETEIILLPAIQAGLEALKAADTSGQLLVFHTSLPTLAAPGKLLNRDDRKLLGTEKEKQILSPQTTAYNELGQSLSAAGVCVELFLANNAYVDAATVGQMCRLSGGGVNKYTYFQADVDGYRLIEDVKRVVSRPTAYDAVMRVRTSTGVRATDFFGHFFMSNTTDVELAAIDADKAIAVEIKHDDKLTAEDGVYVQAALLYTHRSGQRRLRVLNLALNVAHQLADVYRSCELDTVISLLSKQGVIALRDGTPRAVREALTARCARALATYRKHCASPSSAGQLVLPESMKLMPLYISCLLRSDALSGGPDITCDERSVAMYRALTADVASCLAAHYPRLLPLHRAPDGLPLQPLRASTDKTDERGVYLLENGVNMLLWVGSQASGEFLEDVFGVTSAQQIDTKVTELPVLDNPTSEAVRSVIADARKLRRRCMRLTVMRQHDKLEAVLRHFLVEDRGVDGSASYVDFLCHVHKEIRALL